MRPFSLPTRVVEIAMTTRFRGITHRQALLVRGARGWAEWSPFLDYSGAELVPWWRACLEAAEDGFPEPVRDRIPVNCTVPAVGPERAAAITVASGCPTAKVKVAEPGQTGHDDLARVEAVRGALGPSGRVRVDANGGWDVDTAFGMLRRLSRFGLEYAEQPCRTVDELAELRTRLARGGVDVLIAADESIRRVDDPERVVALGAADIAVLKVQPLGGVRVCLKLADRLGLPVVVSSALETSVGLAAGVALAAALPELPYACGLNTAALLADDVGVPAVRAVDGMIAVRPVALDEVAADRLAAPAEVTRFWQARLVQTQARAGER